MTTTMITDMYGEEIHAGDVLNINGELVDTLCPNADCDIVSTCCVDFHKQPIVDSVQFIPVSELDLSTVKIQRAELGLTSTDRYDYIQFKFNKSKLVDAINDITDFNLDKHTFTGAELNFLGQICIVDNEFTFYLGDRDPVAVVLMRNLLNRHDVEDIFLSAEVGNI